MLLKSWFVRKPSEPMLKLMTCSHIAFMHNADKQMCARGTQSWFAMTTTCMHSQHSDSRSVILRSCFQSAVQTLQAAGEQNNAHEPMMQLKTTITLRNGLLTGGMALLNK